jgi:hypothetical protein
MAKPGSIILYGEGKTEAVFLEYLVRVFRARISPRVKVDAGQGGSPRDVASMLIKKHLSLSNYDRALLFLDEDLPVDDIPVSWLKRHSITLVRSTPRCLEGLMLSLLEDPPPAKDRHQSKHWKSRFHKKHLGTDRDSEITARLRARLPDLLPPAQLLARRSRHQSLADILSFLGI